MNQLIQGFGLQFLNSRTVRTNVAIWAANLVAGSATLAGVIEPGQAEVVVGVLFNVAGAMLSNYFRINAQAEFGTR